MEWMLPLLGTILTGSTEDAPNAAELPRLDFDRGGWWCLH